MENKEKKATKKMKMIYEQLVYINKLAKENNELLKKLIKLEYIKE